MNLTEGNQALVRLDDVDEYGVRISSGTLPIPNPHPAVTNDIDLASLLPYIGDMIPIEIVSTDNFDAEVRVLLSELSSDGADHRLGDGTPLPGETITEDFVKARATGTVFEYDVGGLSELRVYNGIPGARLEIQILHVYPDPIENGYVAWGKATDVVDRPTPGTTVDILHDPSADNRNADFDIRPTFAVPGRFPVRYETTAAYCDQSKFSTEDLDIVEPGLLPVRDNRFHAEVQAGEAAAMVRRPDNTDDLPEELAAIVEDYCNWETYEITLLESTEINGTAEIVVRESKPHGEMRAEIDRITSIKGMDDSEYSVGDVVQAETKADKKTATTRPDNEEVVLEFAPPVSSVVEVGITGIEDGILQGEIKDPKRLPQEENTITVEYDRTEREIPVEDENYRIILDEPPLFEQRARVEFTGEYDPEGQKIPVKHLEYLSYPDVGERLTVTYHAETNSCTHPETGLMVEPDESFKRSGKLEIELSSEDGQPIGRVVDYKTMPIVGNTVPASIDYDTPTARTNQGYKITLEDPPVATGGGHVEVTDVEDDRLKGRITAYQLSYLEEGTRLREHLKYQTERFVHDRETPEIEVNLAEQAPSSGIYEIEITQIDDQIRGSIIEEKDSLQTTTASENSGSNQINLGVSSSVL